MKTALIQEERVGNVTIKLTRTVSGGKIIRHRVDTIHHLKNYKTVSFNSGVWIGLPLAEVKYHDAVETYKNK